jgi:tetratricopeptide (TPR) repeat protein
MWNPIRPAYYICIWLVLALSADLRSQPTDTTHDFTALSVRANAARDAEHLEEAIDLYKQALALRPSWAEGWWSLGTLEYDSNSYAIAASAFRHVVVLSPRYGQAWAMLGLCQFELNDHDRALKSLEKARVLGLANEAQLNNVVAYHVGLLQLRKRLYASALSTFEKLARSGVRSEEVALGLAMSLLRMQPSDLPAEDTVGHTAILGIGQASILSAIGKPEEARVMYLSLLQQYPDYPGLHFAYGLFLAADEPQEAMKQMQAELRINPKNAIALLQIATLLANDDPEKAVEYAKKALAINPRPPFAHLLLGQCYLKSGDAAAALPELELARRGMPNEPQLYFALGNAYSSLGRKQDAAHARAEFLRLRGAETSLPAEVNDQPQAPPVEKIGPQDDTPRE